MINQYSKPKSVAEAIELGRIQARYNCFDNEVPYILKSIRTYLAEVVTSANMRGLTCQDLWNELNWGASLEK